MLELLPSIRSVLGITAHLLTHIRRQGLNPDSSEGMWGWKLRKETSGRFSLIETLQSDSTANRTNL